MECCEGHYCEKHPKFQLCCKCHVHTGVFDRKTTPVFMTLRQPFCVSFKYTYKKVLEFFEGNKEKTRLWFRTENPFLGYVTPRQMMQLGRTHKVISLINNRLEDNKP